jgi:hypothetical protein
LNQIPEDSSPAIPDQPSVELMLYTAIQRDNIPVETMERLMAMAKDVRAERARAAFNAAMAAFQAEVPVIPKSKKVHVEGQRGTYDYNYAPLEKIAETVQPILSKHGLSYRFTTDFQLNPPAMVVSCTVTHVEGYSATSEFRAPIDSAARMNDLQKSASAQTYARRYAFTNALGIMTGDQDTDTAEQRDRPYQPGGPPGRPWSNPRAPQGAQQRPGGFTSPAAWGREQRAPEPAPEAQGPRPLTHGNVVSIDTEPADQMFRENLRARSLDLAMAIEEAEGRTRGASEDDIRAQATMRIANWLQEAGRVSLEAAPRPLLEKLCAILEKRHTDLLGGMPSE